MELRAAGDQCGDQRSSDAASDVAHEIHDAGDRVVFLRRNSDVGHQRDGHEQEAQADHLGDAQPGGGTEADQQIDAPGGIKHGDGQGEPAEGDQTARLNLGGELAHDGHFDQQDEAAARKEPARRVREV